MKIKRRTAYFGIAIILFVILILIATVLSKALFIRGFLGDVFVVIFLYYAAKIFYDFKPIYIAVGVFLFAGLIETAQYCQLADKLNLAKGGISRIILGATFDWMDILAYFTGAVSAFLFDSWLIRKEKEKE